ncbi:MAG: sulfatase-like hydrolase/transferase [Acidobacteria bacterium]|nr:sulfatase-like hydrolase/transferase [Acidobacteriota bacterium]
MEGDILTNQQNGTPITRRTWLRLAAAGSGAAALNARSAPRRPNIVLINADDLGYGDLGCFGNTVIQTPNIDRLAAEGVRFTDFVVSWPACTPSRSGLLTGRYPQRNGLYDMIRNNEVDSGFQFDEETYAVSPEMALGLDLREITIGQAMKQAGYATGLAGKWDSGRARRFLPLQRGFDSFYGFANTGIDYYTHERYGVPSMFRGNQRVKEQGHATDLFRREAVRFIADHRSQPFFFYFAPNAPHAASTFDKAASQAPEEYLRMYSSSPNDRKAQYAALVTHLDAAVGALLDELRRHGLEENTLVIFTSDNGGSGPGHNGPLRGAKAQMFEGGIRVPVIARWPGRIPKGTVSKEFASTLEFFPTFLAAAGASPPPGVILDGFNLLPVLEGKAKSSRKEFFWQRRGDKAARVDQWKWVESQKGGGLFDLASDLGEKTDLSASRPDVLRQVKARWAAWRKEMNQCEPRGPFRDY